MRFGGVALGPMGSDWVISHTGCFDQNITDRAVRQWRSGQVIRFNVA